MSSGERSSRSPRPARNRGPATVRVLRIPGQDPQARDHELFPLAHLARAEGDVDTCLKLVDDGILQAYQPGMWRYVSARWRLRDRLAQT